MLLVVYLLCKVVYIMDQTSGFSFFKIKFENFWKPFLSCGHLIIEKLCDSQNDRSQISIRDLVFLPTPGPFFP